ncbi:MAG: hypothetical protein SPI53_00360 [Erysipelotrichaceae bacterium]|nr:hypothetical protein [Erysipelotrichaceae bacterium]
MKKMFEELTIFDLLLVGPIYFQILYYIYGEKLKDFQKINGILVVVLFICAIALKYYKHSQSKK